MPLFATVAQMVLYKSEEQIKELESSFPLSTEYACLSVQTVVLVNNDIIFYQQYQHMKRKNNVKLTHWFLETCDGLGHRCDNHMNIF